MSTGPGDEAPLSGGAPPAWAWPAATALLLAFAFRGLALSRSPTIHNAIDPAERLFFVVSETPPGLVYGLLAWMLYERRGALRDAASREGPARMLAALFLAPAALLVGWSRYVSAPDLLVVALSLTLLGGSALLGGRRALRVNRLPAIFLLFAFPLPAAFVNAVVFPMQLMTTQWTGAILDLAGHDALVRGDLIYTGTHVFHVIETCSGLRATETLLMASVLFIDMFYVNRLHATLLIVLTPFIAFAINLLRVLTMVLNPYSEIVAIHTLQGVATLAVGVFTIAGLDYMLRLLPGVGARQTPPSAAPREATPTSVDLRGRWRAAAGVALLMAAVSVAAPIWQIPTMQPLAVHEQVPPAFGDWRASPGRIDGDFMGSVGFSDMVSRRYRPTGKRDDAKDVDLLVFGSPRIDRRQSMISRKHAYPGSGSQPIDEAPMRTLAGRVGEGAVFRTPRGVRIVYLFTFGIESTPVEVVRATLGLDRGFARREGRAWVIQLSTRIDGEGGGLIGAMARIDEVLGELEESPLIRRGLE